jgi:hypothetical protein
LNAAGLNAAGLGLAALSSLAVAGAAAAAAQPAVVMRMHRAPHPPAPSTLPPPRLVGNTATRLLRPYGGTPVDVLTYHYDQNRTGWNQAETDLTPATVASANFGLIATLTVDGNVLAQPLLVAGFVMPDKSTHDVLIVVTGNDTVYAFDAQTYGVLWQVSLGTQQSTADVQCDDIQGGYGISGTPVIVRTAANKATIYLVSATENTPFNFVSQLHALNLATGADAMPPATIAPSATLSDGTPLSFDPQRQWNRPGLAYNKGSIYIGIGSHCDDNAGSISGWLLRYNRNLELAAAFNSVRTDDSFKLSSIWMTGFAPAIDAGGNVFVATGNGDFVRHEKDWGQSVLKLSPSLAEVRSWFTPAQYRGMNTNDEDFGSGGVMLLPAVPGQTAPPLAVAMGKSSILYLLNQDRLGGLHKNDAGVLQAQHDGGGGVWGGPAYFNGGNGPTVFTQSGGDVLRAWSVATGSAPWLTNTLTGTSGGGYGGSLPIVSSNGSASGTGVVWLINRAQEPFSIEAYNAETLGNPIFSAQVGLWSNAANGNPFLTPMEANGRVYAPGYKMVQVYGLTP